MSTNLSPIVSPHPPTVITILIDEQTGKVSCTPSKEMNVMQVVLVLSSLITQYVEEALLPKSPAQSAKQS